MLIQPPFCYNEREIYRGMNDMEEWLNKRVKMKEGPKKRGIVEYIDDQYIVVYFTFPRKERVIFPSKEAFLHKIAFIDEA